MDDLFLVINDKGHLEQMFLERQYAEQYIAEHGNENYTIELDVLC